MNHSPRIPGLFVTGTDTNVGKTHIACLIVRALRRVGHRVGAYKPVCSGAIFHSGLPPRWEDIVRLQEALAGDWPDDSICPQRFLAPVAPPLAAAEEGRTVNRELMTGGAEWWFSRSDLLVVEGAGGLLSPLSESDNSADLARSFGYPLLIVGRCGLGTINHSLLTIEAARSRGLPLAGVVLNQSHAGDDLSLAESNATEIEQRGQVRVLGITKLGSLDGLHRHGTPVTIPWSDLARC
ncbi:MAG: dethiobiotin synthase [Planctomycetes bacterium]|nr:dethiobiotin synthase [Planctomycetota bacterium]